MEAQQTVRQAAGFASVQSSIEQSHVKYNSTWQVLQELQSLRDGHFRSKERNSLLHKLSTSL